PEHIKLAAKAAIDNNETHYTPVDGTPALKLAIRDQLKRQHGLEFEDNQVIATAGCKQALFNACQALLNPGDEVIIPAPYFLSYPAMVRIAGGEPVEIPTTAASRYKISAEQLDAALTDKTRLMFLCSPNNPTGTAYSRDEFRTFGDVLANYPNVVILTDDIYDELMWTDMDTAHFAVTCPELSERIVSTTSVSKTHAMAGWRLGYASGPAEIIGAMKRIQSQSTSNPCSIAQAAGLAALTGSADYLQGWVDDYKKLHDITLEMVRAIPGIEAPEADGAFFVFADISSLLSSHPEASNDTEFCEWALNTLEVAMVPGDPFGAKNHVRISFATDEATLRKALERLQTALIKQAA
ncbi:MAG: pyridoxal phosphate-dependent aminotransferase, partial [Gammaproteobacteria bacterium]|nr:pyridoxal phosphate-dependent aminotransferase [Gammaproteobacteria bacterium]